MFRSHIAKEKVKKLISDLSGTGTSKLPPERVLAEKFGYSRSTIVKVLNELESEGVVERKIGSGTFIRKDTFSGVPCFAVVMRRTYYRSDEHFRKLIESLSVCAREQGVNIRIFDNWLESFTEDAAENKLLQEIRSRSIQGVLIISRLPLSVTSCLSRLLPTVAINYIFGDGSEVHCVSCDYFRTGFLAGKYLLEKGHKKIAFVTDDLNHPESRVEFSGFQAVLETAGISLSEGDILETRHNAESIIDRSGKFFYQAGYTACFIRNSFLLSPFMQSLREYGISGKLDIVVSGNYDNYVRRGWTLAVIDNKLEDMCRLGLQQLIRLAGGSGVTMPNLILLKPELL